ncbi:hypothetical protein LTR08_001501 [Meristemomyces frigidus]|nr:hypothetical protein LTR08_001501 [Meristemomyces frigidus]
MPTKSSSRSFIAPIRHREQQILTRYQERRIRQTFPFLDLPAELRLWIYDLCIDVTTAQKLLERYYQKLKDTTNIKGVKAPLIYSKCPTILRINRQIFAEASIFVPKRSLTFNHGLLDLLTVKDFVPESLLRNVSTITIDDSGHPLFKENILAASWMGYVTLIEQLAEILEPGHRLKQLTISLTSDELVPHVKTCWTATYSCGFRDTLRRACDALRTIRGVGNVTLVGFPQPLALELKVRMQSTRATFLTIPRELRDMIYAKTLDWSDISQQLVRTLADWTDKSQKPPYPKRSTPTVLLLNHQIHDEAVAVLHAKPLTIICPADHNMKMQAQVPNLLHFITRDTLRNVRHLSLKLESWEWIYSIDFLLPAFVATAQRTTQLTSVHLHFNDTLKTRFLADIRQRYPDNTLHTTLTGFTRIRGLSSVTFSGDLPSCYTVPLARIMQTPAHVGVAALPKLMALSPAGEIVDADDD